MKQIDWANTTTEDICDDPHKFGLPTFEEFVKYPGKWKRRADEAMIALEGGPSMFRKHLKRIKFFIHGKKLSGIEELERALGDYGYKTFGNEEFMTIKKTIEYANPGAGIDHDIHINFLP